MRAALESLLRARKLDVTVTPFGPSGEPLGPVADHSRIAPTGVPALDAALGGGLRRGHLSEITGAPSSGRTTVAVQALAAATARGEAVALVDPGDTFDPAPAAASGVALPQLLWVRVARLEPREARATHANGAGHGVPASERVGESEGQSPSDENATSRALKACSLILQAGGFGLVVFDLAGVAPALLRRFPATTWMRLARIVEGSETVALLIAGERLARSAGGVTIACEAAAAGWQGRTHRARVFTGLAAAPRVVGGRR